MQWLTLYSKKVEGLFLEVRYLCVVCMLTPHVTPFTYKWISSSTNINVEKCFWCILRQKQNKTTTHIALQCVKYKHSRTTHEANSQVSINMRAIHPCLSISEMQTINDGIPFFSFLNARNRLHVLTYAAWGRCFSTAALRGHASALHLSLGCASSTLLVSGSGSGNAGVFSEKFDNFDSRETNCGETWRWVTEPLPVPRTTPRVSPRNVAHSSFARIRDCFQFPRLLLLKSSPRCQTEQKLKGNNSSGYL